MMQLFARTRHAVLKARTWLLPAALLCLAGCSVLPEQETLAFYRLPAPAAEAHTHDDTPDSAAVLRIGTPYGNRAVDSTRILVLPEPERLSAYKGARWSDSAPVLLRDRLVEFFRASGAFRSIVTDSGGLGADLELSGDLSRFHVIYREGAPVVVATLEATLVRTSPSAIVASRRFNVEQPVQGKEVPEVVQAFGVAVDELAVNLLAWAREQARSAP